jgi:hypothetical protein
MAEAMENISMGSAVLDTVDTYCFALWGKGWDAS